MGRLIFGQQRRTRNSGFNSRERVRDKVKELRMTDSVESELRLLRAVLAGSPVSRAVKSPVD